MFSWESSFSSLISRNAVMGNCGKDQSRSSLLTKSEYTPSFSLCINIFFNATMAPVLRDFARCTSLYYHPSVGHIIFGGFKIPESAFSELAQNFII
jgi:hypothetical protein